MPITRGWKQYKTPQGEKQGVLIVTIDLPTKYSLGPSQGGIFIAGGNALSSRIKPLKTIQKYCWILQCTMNMHCTHFVKYGIIDFEKKSSNAITANKKTLLDFINCLYW